MEERKTVITTREEMRKVPGGDLRMVVTHNSLERDVVHWRASTGGFLFGNSVGGKVGAGEDLSAAMDKAEEKCRQAGELLLKLAEVSRGDS